MICVNIILNFISFTSFQFKFKIISSNFVFVFLLQSKIIYRKFRKRKVDLNESRTCIDQTNLRVNWVGITSAIISALKL